ncbi:phage baseplate protein [Arabiibacter massiliensis]|uniref:phage baseplate protein n=1 Tax=Arabiibacter massiliensis TaxID=1870985 RepID=UPI0009BB0553|nr:hypothetical protein [Arabiibacter massiliensis]
MDAFEIARLFALQGDADSCRLRFGTVESIERDTLMAVPDGEAAAVPAVRCCHPAPGSRVVLAVCGTTWLAISAIGGDSPCPVYMDDIWITFSNDDPHDRWPGTRWEKLHDRMLLASGKRDIGDAGGEEEHTLTKAEMPSHAHALIGYWRVPNSGDFQVASYRGIASDPPTTEEDSSVRYNGGSQPHNNMPPYTVVHMWRRVA